MRKLALVFVTAAALLVAAAPATARTWTVWAGPSGLLKKPPRGTPPGTEVDEFLPAALRIHAGDSVRVTTREGHTFTALGKKRLGDFTFFARDPQGAVYSGINDFAGNPFWFNGKPKFVYTAGPILNPAGSTTIADHGFRNRTLVPPSPGNPPGLKPSATFRFPKAGRYRFLCLFHVPVMKMTVIVAPKGAPVPSRRDVARGVDRQIKQALETAKALTKTRAPANMVLGGATRGSEDLLAFFPNRLVVAPGTTVRFLAGSTVNNHNQVFGDPKSAWIRDYLSTSDQFPTGQLGPEEVYGTEPAGGYSYDGTNHGNGFLVTPVADRQSTTSFADAAQVTFPTAGTYHYFCQIHGPAMAGDIVVR